MLENMGNLFDMLRQAGKMRETVQNAFEALSHVEVEGSAGGGVVTAKVNGRLELLKLRIDPKLLVDGDAELLEDLVIAAVNQAVAKSRDEAARVMQGAAGNFPIGDLSTILGSGQE